MNRRDALLSLASSAVGAAVLPDLAEALQKGALTDADVESLLRALAGLEPRPGEAEAIRTMLSRLRTTAETDPRLQPGFRFHPEVEP